MSKISRQVFVVNLPLVVFQVLHVKTIRSSASILPIYFPPSKCALIVNRHPQENLLCTVKLIPKAAVYALVYVLALPPLRHGLCGWFWHCSEPIKSHFYDDYRYFLLPQVRLCLLRHPYSLQNQPLRLLDNVSRTIGIKADISWATLASLSIQNVKRLIWLTGLRKIPLTA